MGMENYNPPQDPWLVILYQDEHIMVVNKPAACCPCQDVWKRTKIAL
ncbi:ribosomal large subunit pseudouridine synthase A [Salmonella enterica subsp. arizonae]|uniref:Ribosomal large subunit pseudouridine synthase A n=1 Tax=Salmonella enterica subsp. arizonae TaxID=59203 RepID=A0A2X4TX92_SALER|nr:ribosomal large subunit pseudouridine synthase A [Salmonella enterica subsp. arizonae]